MFILRDGRQQGRFSMFHAQLEMEATLILEVMKLNYILKKMYIFRLGVSKQQQNSS